MTVKNTGIMNNKVEIESRVRGKDLGEEAISHRGAVTGMDEGDIQAVEESTVTGEAENQVGDLEIGHMNSFHTQRSKQ